MNFPEIRALYDIGSANHGIAETEITAAETRLGLTLPAMLRTYYAELGAHEALNQTQDTLLLPNELQISHTGTHLVFYAENQWVCTWGIALPDLALPDPPVWLSYDDVSSHVAAPVWQPEANTLSSFLLAMAHLQALFALPYTANVVGISADTLAQVRAGWPELPVRLSLWSVTFLQAAPDHLLALMPNSSQSEISLFVAAKTKKAFKKLLNALDLEWDYNSLEDED